MQQVSVVLSHYIKCVAVDNVASDCVDMETVQKVCWTKAITIVLLNVMAVGVRTTLPFRFQNIAVISLAVSDALMSVYLFLGYQSVITNRMQCYTL